MRIGEVNVPRLVYRGMLAAILAALCATVSPVQDAAGEGNLTRRAERLDELKIDAKKGFSKKFYQLETGKYYRWRIVSDGRDEYSFRFPELSRNVWTDQVVIEEKEVKPFGGVYAIEFDEEGEVDVFFVPIRPGTYEFYVENYRESGMLGTIEVK